jgi:LacI family transcriptional regulator
LNHRTIEPEGRRVTLRDVADHAHCSTATVSRTLNNPEQVAAEVKARVERSIKALGYVPNGAARALRSQHSHIVGAVIPTINYAIYARLIEGLEQRLAVDRYSLILTTSDYDPGKEFEQMRLLLTRGVEGIVLVGDSHDTALYQLLSRHRKPYVNTYIFNPASKHPCIGFDNRAASAKAARYLHDLGHRRIAVVAGITRSNDRQAERLAGVREAMQGYGLTLPDNYVVERQHLIENGREAIRILFQLPEPPTAVLCGSDVLAFGVLSECHEIKISVPAELSIIGFDDQDFARHLRPPLTTIGIPASQMGVEAANYILRKIYRQAANNYTNLDAQLIVRGTTSPPGKALRRSVPP